MVGASGGGQGGGGGGGGGGGHVSRGMGRLRCGREDAQACGATRATKRRLLAAQTRPSERQPLTKGRGSNSGHKARRAVRVRFQSSSGRSLAASTTTARQSDAFLKSLRVQCTSHCTLQHAAPSHSNEPSTNDHCTCLLALVQSEWCQPSESGHRSPVGRSVGRSPPAGRPSMASEPMQADGACPFAGKPRPRQRACMLRSCRRIRYCGATSRRSASIACTRAGG